MLPSEKCIKFEKPFFDHYFDTKYISKFTNLDIQATYQFLQFTYTWLQNTISLKSLIYYKFGITSSSCEYGTNSKEIINKISKYFLSFTEANIKKRGGWERESNSNYPKILEIPDCHSILGEGKTKQKKGYVVENLRKLIVLWEHVRHWLPNATSITVKSLILGLITKTPFYDNKTVTFCKNFTFNCIFHYNMKQLQIYG